MTDDERDRLLLDISMLLGKIVKRFDELQEHIDRAYKERGQEAKKALQTLATAARRLPIPGETEDQAARRLAREKMRRR